jgi:hypothetical protein
MFSLIFCCLIVAVSPSSLASTLWTADGPVDVATPLTALGPRDFDLNALVAAVDPPHACAPLANNLTGKIALVSPNLCYPYQKAKHAEDAGAAGVLLYGYRKTFGLLIFVNGPRDGEISVPVAELALTDESVADGSNFTISPSSNPMLELSDAVWAFYTTFFAVYDFAVVGLASIKLFFFVRAKKRSDDWLPVWVLGLICVTCVIRVPILIDPNGTRGLLTWGAVESFMTLDFSFAVVSALVVARYWHGVVRVAVGGTAGEAVFSRKFKITILVVSGLLLLVEIATSVLRGLLMPAMPFLMGKVFLYCFTSLPTAVYFAWSGRKLLKMARDQTGTVPDRLKKKAYAGFVASSCLVLFPITAFLVATPMYHSPTGYFMLRFLAGLWLYTATLMLGILFELKREQTGKNITAWISTAEDPSMSVDA